MVQASAPRRSSRSMHRLRVREISTAYITVAGKIPTLATPTMVAAVLGGLFDTATDPRESLYVLAFDARRRLIGVERVARGGINSCAGSVRDILTLALVASAPSVIIAHNHPSGDPSPSGEDIHFTCRLLEAASLLEVEIADHIIVGAGATEWASMRELGLLS
jgi:DNA repair protein RadC